MIFFSHLFLFIPTGALQVALVVKNSPANAGDLRGSGLDPGLGRSSGGGHVTHSSILVWRIPCTKETGGLWSMGLQRVGHKVTSHTHTHTHTHTHSNLMQHLMSSWVV